MNRFKKIIDNALILAWGEHQGGHPFWVFRTGAERMLQGSDLHIRTKKARSLLQFLSDATNHIAILFGLTLTDVKSLQGQPVIHGSQLGTRSLTPLRIIHPLGGNGFSASSRLKTTVGDKFENCPVVDTPKGAKIPVAPKFVKVSKFHGITDIHAFNGFHSFYSFLRKTFFHTRYVLVTDKDTEKVSMPVYNLSVNKDESYVIPPGIVHNCRCTVVQVRKGKYPESNEQEAMKLGMEATAGKYREMFLFNPGKTMTCFPAYNAYTRRKCIHCKHRPGNMELAAEIDADALCHVCLQTQQELAKGKDIMPPASDTYEKVDGKEVYISPYHGENEVEENERLARFITERMKNVKVWLLPRLNPNNMREAELRQQLLPPDVFEGKNPDYYINGMLFDAKSMMNANVTDDPAKQKSMIENRIKKAKEQADNIVLEIPEWIEFQTIARTINNYLGRSKKKRTILVCWKERLLKFRTSEK